MSTASPTIAAKPRRRWFQFGLRTMLVAMTVVGLGAAWLGLDVKRALDQRVAVKLLQAKGASVIFGEPRTWLARQEWARAWFGDEAILDVVEVHLWGSEVGDEEMAHLRGLTQLTVLSIEDAQLTDAGLAHLQGLTQFELLMIENTQVSDEGLTHLRELTKLIWLDLENTHVTDAGLAHIRGLTQLKSLRLDNSQVTDQGVKEFQNALPNCHIFYPRRR